MGRFETVTVIALVDVVYEGTSYKAGAVFTVPARAAVRLLMTKQVKAAPKGTPPPPSVRPMPTPAPVAPATETSAAPKAKKGKVPGPQPGIPKDAPTKAAPDAAASEDRTYQRRDLVPEE